MSGSTGTTGGYSSPKPKKSSPSVSSSPSSNGLLRYGSQGSSVRKLQQALGITADGIYGANTQAAVRNYQKSHGLSVDGIAGNQTLGALYSSPSNRVSVPAATNSGSALPVQAKATTSPKVSNPSTNSINDQINKMYDAQQKSQIDSLTQSQRKATSQVNAQKKSTVQDYYNQKNQADVVNQQNVQKLRELMAANGLTGSGENVTANVNLANQRQSSLNNLNTKEQQAMDAYNQQMYNINDPAQAQQIRDQIAAQRAQALSNQYWNSYQFNNIPASQQATNAMSWANNQATLQQQQAALNQQIAALQGATGSGFSGVSGGGGNYQNQLAQAMAKDGMPASQVPYFDWVIQHESSYNPNAQNKTSTAHGYGQFLNSTAQQYDKKMGLNYNSNPVDQLQETYQYMVDRYGSPQGAMNFWKVHGWY